MFLRYEVHQSSATEHRPVHVILPSPVSWVPEVHPSSGETAPEKRSPGIFCTQAGKGVHWRQGKRASHREKEALLPLEEKAERVCET